MDPVSDLECSNAFGELVKLISYPFLVFAQHFIHFHFPFFISKTILFVISESWGMSWRDSEIGPSLFGYVALFF